MSCHFCGNPEEFITLRFSRDKKKQTLTFCSLCAAERGILQRTSGLFIDLDDLVRIRNDDPAKSHSLKCPSCGMSHESIVRMGLTGCPDCYSFFKEDLLLMREEGTRHPASIEKLMKRQKLQSLLQNLERELKLFVEQENYEDAAEMRDKINRLKEKLGMPHES